MKEYIYIVRQIKLGWISDISYHKTEDGSLNKFKEVVKNEINRVKSNNDFAKKDDLPDGYNHKNGEIIKTDDKKLDEFSEEKTLYTSNIFYWYRTSYEYDEYDVESVEYRIVKVELLK